MGTDSASGRKKRTSLLFEAPPACGGKAAFEERVLERSRHIEFVEAAPEHEVRLELEWGGSSRDLHPRDSRPLVAHLRVQRPLQSPLDRRISARSCEEALEALALMVAIALDPEGIVGTEPVASERPTVGAEPEAPASTDTGGSHWRVFLGAGVQVQGAAAPEGLVGPELSAGLDWLRDSMWSPSMRVGVSRTSREDLQAAGGIASFELAALTLEACPLRATLAAVSLGPCLFGNYGRLLARGADTVAARSVERPWWVVGASAWLAWAPTPFAALTATARLGRPGVRDTFQFEPLPFHRVPAWAASGSLGLEVRFP